MQRHSPICVLVKLSLQTIMQMLRESYTRPRQIIAILLCLSPQSLRERYQGTDILWSIRVISLRYIRVRQCIVDGRFLKTAYMRFWRQLVRVLAP
jgi:hypothetical protein